MHGGQLGGVGRRALHRATSHRGRAGTLMGGNMLGGKLRSNDAIIPHSP